MTKRIGIFGTSGFARETGDVALAVGLNPVFIARDRSEADSWTFPDEILIESEIERYSDLECIIGIGENTVRRSIARRFADKVRFANLIHPNASFGKNQKAHIETKSGIIVCAGVRFTNNIKVGDFSIFNLNATIGHDVDVEEFTNIAPGVNVSGNVHIQSGCWIGTGAVINQGLPGSKLIIGANTMIGSGSVVVRSCDSDATYVGIPAKRIK